MLPCQLLVSFLKLKSFETLDFAASHLEIIDFLALQTVSEKTLEILMQPQSPIHGDEHAQLGVSHVRSEVLGNGHGDDD